MAALPAELSVQPLEIGNTTGSTAIFLKVDFSTANIKFGCIGFKDPFQTTFLKLIYVYEAHVLFMKYYKLFCPGFFSLLCDEIDRDAICGKRGRCCITRAPRPRPGIEW